MTANYRNDAVYSKLEKIVVNAGVKIYYKKVHDDTIDGAIWARSDSESRTILMPDTDVFPDEETACVILGHEMGHILTGLDSPDDPCQRRINEETCDLIGALLYKLAVLSAEYAADESFRQAIVQE